jgi:hypothetical protein
MIYKLAIANYDRPIGIHAAGFACIIAGQKADPNKVCCCGASECLRICIGTPTFWSDRADDHIPVGAHACYSEEIIS